MMSGRQQCRIYTRQLPSESKLDFKARRLVIKRSSCASVEVSIGSSGCGGCWTAGLKGGDSKHLNTSKFDQGTACLEVPVAPVARMPLHLKGRETKQDKILSGMVCKPLRRTDIEVLAPCHF